MENISEALKCELMSDDESDWPEAPSTSHKEEMMTPPARKQQRSWVWDNFLRESPTSAMCKICHKTISCKSGSTSGMMNHSRLHGLSEPAKKPQVPDDKTERPDKSTTKPDEKEISRKLDELQNDPSGSVTRESSSTSWAWKYFQKEGQMHSKCKVCGRVISRCRGSTTGMIMHLKTHGLGQAGKQDDDPSKAKDKVSQPAVKERKTSSKKRPRKSWVWSYFEKESASEAKCKKCTKIIKRARGTTTGMRKHLLRHDIDGESPDEYADEDEINDVTDDFEESMNSSAPKIKAEPEENFACVVCNGLLQDGQSGLSNTLSFSYKPLYQVLESFTGSELSEDSKTNSSVCQQCFAQLERYDEFQHLSNEIQKQITNMYQETHSQQVSIKQEPEFDYQSFVFTSHFYSPQPQQYVSRPSSPKPRPTVNKPSPKPRTLKHDSGNKPAEPFQCDQCDKKFHDRSNLLKHLKRHSPEGFRCKKCPKVCKSEMHLQSHVVTEHSCVDGIFECPVCFKTFVTKSAFQNHHYMHRQDNNWLCVQ